uniref:TIR domain-containing protein n=1 Tax=Sparus aurata TaxID=8175 RepID=A0A671UTT5_SPAAU
CSDELQLSVFALCLLLHPHLSLSYSLKNCSVVYSEDASADMFLDCSSRKLVAVPDDIPKEAVSVKLSLNQLQQINREDFGVLLKLKVLFLHSNQITHVDDGSFVHMVSLTELRLSFNKLTNLTRNLFQGLSSLTKLDLAINNIQFIHPSAFQSLSSLQTLILNSNKLQHVADIRPVLQLPHLKNLNVSNNLFHSFQTKDLLLNTTSGLQRLDVALSKYENFSITSQIFPDLEMIDFSQSSLKWVEPDGPLLRNITRLHFSQTVIPFDEIQNILRSADSLMELRLNNTVCKIPTLEVLDLTYNDDANLSAKLVTCSQLSQLYMSVTQMAELPKGSLRSMKRLQSLVLDSNFLTRVPDDIRSLSSLENLKLNNNQISTLGCEDFVNTTNLQQLYLHNNRIAKLDRCVFRNLNELKVLDLSRNLLCTFGGAFEIGPQQLEFLDLSKNDMYSLENGVFKGLGSLKYLNVMSDKTVNVNRMTFDGMKNLRTLHATLPYEYESNFVGLQRLENFTVYLNTDLKSAGPGPGAGLFQLKSMKFLTITYRDSQHDYPFDMPVEMLRVTKHLEYFTAENLYLSAPSPDTFQFNPQLKSLTIRKADLSDLGPGLFKPLSNLQALDLSSNQLKSLDFLAQADLSALRCLRLSDNEITVINETIFQSLPSLTYLDLGNNPFTCDCSNAGFIQWVKSNNQTYVANGYQYTCAFPVYERGGKLLDFDVQFCWMDVGFFCFVSSTCVVLLTLLTSFIYHFLRWQLVYTFYLFRAFLYDSRKRKKGSPNLYDAFISYNVQDEDWVYREMLPVLEGEQGWRLCLHHRDFQPGKPIIENITDAIYGSRKTICVISQRYLQSEWCSREIQMASFRLFDEQKDILVLLFLEEIPAYQLSPYHRMRKLLKRRTYLSWPQAGQHTSVFWQNISRALDTGDGPTDGTDLLTGAVVR